MWNNFINRKALYKSEGSPCYVIFLKVVLSTFMLLSGKTNYCEHNRSLYFILNFEF